MKLIWKICSSPFLVVAATILVLACNPTADSSTTENMGIYQNSQIVINPSKTSDDIKQTAYIGKGDLDVFIYAQTKNYGEEGSGYSIAFEIPKELDTAVYDSIQSKHLIIGFGTGLAPHLVDTILNYKFKISKSNSTFFIDGQVGGKNITGKYIPM